MSVYVDQNASFEVTFDMGLAGLVGTIAVQIVDGVGNVVQGPSVANIIESPPGSGIYTATRIAPAVVGQYDAVASTDGSFLPQTVAVEDIIVFAGVADVVIPPIIPLSPLPGPSAGPCTAWLDGETVAACCNSSSYGSDPTLLDMVATTASSLLFNLSGRLYQGVCSKTVRPCLSGHCGFQTLSRGHIVDSSFEYGYGWYDRSWWWGGRKPCGCQPLSQIKLSGYPIREIIEVRIDGSILDASEYDLRDWRYLVRMADVDGHSQWWPSCQRLDLANTEVGTWSVTYIYGADPPQAAVDAAAQLACELWKQCEDPDNCRLPIGATRVTRQGITIERQFFNRDPTTQSWRTGLELVDLFLNTYNPAGLRRRPTIWSPDGARYPRTVV